jgi:hypothetical protein
MTLRGFVMSVCLVAVGPGARAQQAPGTADPLPRPSTAVAAAEPETRADLLRQQREQRAVDLQPPDKPGLVDRIWEFVDASYGPGAAQWSGVAPRVGSVVAGGGFAVGARYRNTLLFDRYADVDISAIGSYKRYYRVDGSFGSRQIGHTPLFARVEAGVREYPQEDFFGIGSDTSRDARTNFLFRETRMGLRGGVQLWHEVSAGATLALLNPGVGRGRDSLYPSIEEEFSEESAPGLSTQPKFVVTSVFFDMDRVGTPEQARVGSAARVTWTNASDRDTGHFSHRQLEIDARHYFPFLQDKRVVVVRGLFSTAYTDEGAEMPFYMQPFLGGRRTLRGYDDQRYRAPHVLLLQAEYRFEVWPIVDMAVFLDAGTVSAQRRDLDFRDLEEDYGVSFRFGGDQAVFRIDIALGGETRRYSVAFGDVF